jgi:putative transposase
VSVRPASDRDSTRSIGRAATIARLKDIWAAEHVRWRTRELAAKRYVYIWTDGVHLQARLEDDAQCVLVIVGATPDGKRE